MPILSQAEGFRQTQKDVPDFSISEYTDTMIKLETLRVFITVADAGNIRDAASLLGRTPSAISMTLKQLEADLGAPLFASDRKNMLSELGAFVFEHARSQIAAYDRMIEAIRARAENRTGRLCVACVPSVATTLLPDVVEALLSAHEDLEVELLDVDSLAVARLVESGEVDFGISAPPPAGSALSYTPLFRDRFKVVCCIEDPLASLSRPVRWGDLSQRRLIRSGATDRLSAAEWRALFASAPLVARNVSTLLGLVRAGIGVTLLPALATVQLPAGLVALPLDADEIRRDVGIIERPGAPRGPLSESFLDLVRLALPAWVPDTCSAPLARADCQ